MPKKKRIKTSKTNKSPLIIINIIIAIFLVIALAFLTNIFITDSKYEQIQSKIEKEKQELLNKEQELKKEEEKQAQYFEEKTKAMEIEYTEVIIQPEQANTFLPQENPKTIFRYEEEEEKETVIKKEIVQEVKEAKIIQKLPSQKVVKKGKPLPKLSIIIDDVTNKYQVKKINKIPYPVTMAFLPPTSRHKNSAKISKNIDTYMIHLPLEAGSKKYEEENTLHINDSLSTIDKRIKDLSKLYPKAKYINNHTGSKFTANKKAMDKLLKTLKRYNFIFVDSRTTAKTVSKQYAKKYNVKRLSRNIFLDNKQDKKYIQKQLKKAVRIAKRDGFAIAICHPHNITLKTLAQSKYLLKGLDLVLINEL